MKKVLAACIDQWLWFSSEQELKAYEENLKAKHQTYAIQDFMGLEDGSCKVRIRKQYNRSPFLKGGEQND